MVKTKLQPPPHTEVEKAVEHPLMIGAMLLSRFSI
jgi:hypothetical protein